MFEEWSATLTLTEESSKELFRVLQEQDEAFINDVLDGKCGFTLESADGRRVELVPKADRKTEPQTEYDKYREKIRPHDPHKDWFEDEPQTDCSWR